MTTHFQKVEGIFKERVLPQFPSAEERFKKHFHGSYQLLRGAKDVHPMDFGLCVLGLKPLSTMLQYASLQKVSNRITEAGLELAPVFGDRIFESLDSSAKLFSKQMDRPFGEVRKKLAQELKLWGLEAWIYDPVITSDLISRRLNSTVSPEDVKKHLAKFQNMYELLGYPQDIHYFGESLILKVLSFSFGDYPPPTTCSVPKPDLILSSLEARASAAAIIEEIRESSVRIRSASIIYSQLNRFDKIGRGVVIKRSKEVGEWSVANITNMPSVLINLPQFLLHWHYRKDQTGVSNPEDCS